MKAYVILKKGFEYDDNIYNESEGGNPQIVCFSKEDAKIKVDQLNFEEYKIRSLTEYTYDLEDVLSVDVEDYEKFNESLVEKYGPIVTTNRWDDTENILHPKASVEESKKYCDMTTLSFYDVVETEVDMESYRDYKIGEIIN
jgi:hypothetical protein